MSPSTSDEAREDADLDPTHFLAPPPRPRLYEEVARRIVTYIQGLDLRPGHRLPSERELAHRLSVSRTSVRQAVVSLSTRGVIEVRAGDGMYVREIAPSTSAASTHSLPDTDVSDAREAIEVKLAELAAIRRNNEEIAALERSIEAMAADIAAGGIGREAAGEFHQIVTRAARSPVLARMMATLAQDFDAARQIALEHPDRPRRSLEHHRVIVSALRKGDPEAASQAMRLHLRVMADLSAEHNARTAGAEHA
jgi:GntR family transcriptional repressor for pyruvate dehydrogenase complex